MQQRVKKLQQERLYLLVRILARWGLTRSYLRSRAQHTVFSIQHWSLFCGAPWAFKFLIVRFLFPLFYKDGSVNGHVPMEERERWREAPTVASSTQFGNGRNRAIQAEDPLLEPT